MLKALLLNTLFICTLSIAAYAEDEINEPDFGKEKPKSYTLANRSSRQLQSFSLKSNMTFKGENLISAEPAAHYISFNTSIIFQKGQNTYLLPYKKKVVLNRVTFNPNELLRNYSGR